jgi:hypothetical protein
MASDSGRRPEARGGSTSWNLERVKEEVGHFKEVLTFIGGSQ